MGFMCQTLLLATLIFHAMCYPEGTGVDSSCTGLTPQHGASSQTSAVPYSVTFNPTSFTPGQTVAVTLSSTSTGFKGFMIQARRADTNQNQEMLGSFTGISTTRQACTGKALVHSSSTVKASLTFSWNVPATSVGNITFRVTYVRSAQVFWANRVSGVLVETIPTTTTTTTTTSTTTRPTTTTPTTTTPTTTTPTTTTPTTTTPTTTTPTTTTSTTTTPTTTTPTTTTPTTTTPTTTTPTTTTSTTTTSTTTTPTTTTPTTTKPTTTTPTTTTTSTTTIATTPLITTVSTAASTIPTTTTSTTALPTTTTSATTSMTSTATTTSGALSSTASTTQATSASTTSATTSTSTSTEASSTTSTSPSTEASSTTTPNPTTETSATTSTRSPTTSSATTFTTSSTVSLTSTKDEITKVVYTNNDTSSTPNIVTKSPQEPTTTLQDTSQPEEAFSTSPSSELTTRSGAVAYDSACGVTKGCFTSCDAARCNFVASWQVTGAAVTYTLSATRAADSGIYIALGFSGDSKMGDDSVMGCVYKNNVFAKYTGFNDGKSPTAFSDNEIQLTSSNYANGVLTCQLTRPLAGSGQRYNLSQPWTLLFVEGSASIDNGEASISYHNNDVYISPAPVSAPLYLALSSETSTGANLVKAHGCLMVAAWIFLASIGTVVARFYKPVLTGTMCSQKVWFQLHRLTMVLVLCATASGFIIIFVKEKEWSQIEGEASYLQGHPIMGVIVMILTLLNPSMALFRPHPGTPKRPIFNWAHLVVGMSAHILGVITIFFGVKLRSAQTPDYAVKILGAYVAWQLFVYLLLEITTRCNLFKKGKGELYELDNVNSLKLDKPRSHWKSAVKNLVLAVHCFVVAALTATIIAVIAVGV